VVTRPEAGRLVDALTGDAFAAGIADLLAHLPDRSQVRRYAEGFGWEATSQAQLSLFRHLVAEAAHA
jgi:teichuronic acid biosynthesis glycosyltransferase TuaC